MSSAQKSEEIENQLERSTEVIEGLPSEDIIVLDLEGTDGLSSSSSDCAQGKDGKGTRVIVHLHGATILSWTCQGKEQLFLSSKSVFDGKKAIRGGIPLVFPNFGPWNMGPQHGFARIKRWTLIDGPTETGEGEVKASFQLDDDEETQKLWSYKFRVVYTLTLSETSLACKMAIHNTGSYRFHFTCLFHTYFRVPDIEATSLTGLKDLEYVDKVRNSGEFVEDREAVTIDGNYDRVYRKSPSTVHLQVNQINQVQLTSTNMADIVVWNPWKQKAKEMGDFDDDGWRYMVCVEAGQVSSPFLLPAGKTMECSQVFTVLPQ